MKRIVRILGLATVLTALLVVSIAGTVFAANGPQGGDEAPYGDGDCVCDCECLGDGACTCQNWCGEAGPHGEGAGNSHGEASQHRVRSGKVVPD